MASDINEILKLLNQNIINNNLVNSEKIQFLLNSKINEFKISYYDKIINLILKKLGLNNEENIKKILFNRPKFKISTYKKILKIEASKEFDKFKSDNESLFVSLSKNICNDLEDRSVKDVLNKYSKELDYINEITNSDELVHLIKEHKDSLNLNGNLMSINTRAKIREFTRSFNIKYKEYFIKKYVDQMLEKIKDDFELKINYDDSEYCLISEDAFAKLFLKEIITTNSFKMKIHDYFNLEVDNNIIEKIIRNIINNNDSANYAILGIDNNLKNIGEKNEKLNENKAFNRLNRNYLKTINSVFKNFDKEILVNILNNINCINNYKQYLTKHQINLLFKIQQIYKEAKCECIINNNEIIFIKNDQIQGIELSELKNDYLLYKKYLGIKKVIMEYYIDCSKSRNEVMNLSSNNHYQIIFDDDNYKIKNNELIINIKVLFDLINSLNVEIIRKYDDDTIDYLKKIIFNDGILNCVMKYNVNINISNIINGIGNIQSFDKIKNLKNVDLEFLIKQTNLYSKVDDFTISILSVDITNKIINNRQFLQSIDVNNYQKSLSKAVDLSIRSIYKDKSAIPYNITTKLNNIVISRYNSNDPNLIVSGIDTNTCFKLDGNDNDFVFYTILNKNGAVLKINDTEGNFIGRMSIFRQANVIFVNGIRTIAEKEQSISKEIIDQNIDIFNCLISLSNKLIELSTNSDLPIDFVVCNKAGILESSYFNSNFYIVPEHIIKNPLDFYNDDWQEFIHTYDNYKYNYFNQVNKGNQNIFQTDFGSYPALLIASRNNRLLQSKFDISYSSPDDIYKRPNEEAKVYTSGFDKALDKVYRIDAIKFLYEVGDIEKAKKLFKRKQYSDIKEILTEENSYEITFNNGLKISNSINNNSSLVSKKFIKSL